MNGIIINIDPVMLRLGHFELRWYSVIVVLAIISAIVIAALESKKKGLSPEIIFSMAPWVIIGGFIGARLFHVFDRWDYYAANPLQIIMVQQGGLAIWGALAVGLATMVGYAIFRRIPVLRLADVMVPALLVAQIIGRFACIINGDAYGGVTSLPWGFIYTHPGAMIPSDLAGVPTHPYPVYEMLWNLVGLLLVIRFRRNLNADGLLFLGYLSYYAVGRFFFSFVRREAIWFWGLQEAQVLSIVILVIAIGMMAYLVKKQRLTTVSR